MTQKKNLIIVACIIAFAGIMFLLKKNPSKTEVKVVVEKVLKRNITEIVTATGKVYPVKEVKVSPDVSGEITEMYVKEGDSVSKGTLLCKINPEIYATQLDRAKASLNNSKANFLNAQAQLLRAKASLKLLESQYLRSKKLFSEKVISGQEYETAESQYESAKADVLATEKMVEGQSFLVQSANAGVNESIKSYNRTNIYSPSDGIVSALNFKAGERVVGTAQMQGSEIMRISNFDDMEIRVEVNENDIVRIKTGDSTDIEIDAYRNKKFKGIVYEVSNATNSSNTIANVAEQVTNYIVKIKILKSSYLDLLQENSTPFRSGMTATVDIHTKVEKNVLSIPIQAVTIDKNLSENENNKNENTKEIDNKLNIKQEIVWVVNKNEVTKRKVKTSIQDNVYIKVTEGLNENEIVVSSPYEAITKKLRNGKKVKVVQIEQLFEEEK